jgi:hypothetical protein
VSLSRLLRWTKPRRTPLWDPESSQQSGPVRFYLELKTAAEIMESSRERPQQEFAGPGSETGTAA